MNIPFFRPSISPQAYVNVKQCLDSGWLTTGPWCELFEKRIKQKFNGEVEVVLVTSATAGLHLALLAANVGPGDEVIIPTLTFTATAEAVVSCGATPVLVDVDPETLNIDLVALKRAIGPHTKAVVPVHFAGRAINIDALQNICKNFDIKIIEDAAHAFGASYNGKKVGLNDSLTTVFSFYANKPLATGEGGAILTRNKNIAAKLRQLRSHGISQDTFTRSTKMGSKWKYDVICQGFKYNMSDLLAAVGVAQLELTDQHLDERQKISEYYVHKLSHLPVKFFYEKLPNSEHGAHIFPIKICVGNREEMITYLDNRGIGTSVHYKPLHQMPYWSSYAVGQKFNVADEYFQNCLSLPLYPGMNEMDVTRVVNTLETFFTNQNAAQPPLRDIKEARLRNTN